MRLGDYFDFLADDDIRLKGSRVGIESVLYEYIYREQKADAIAQKFPSLTLEQVYVTILYYLHNRERVEAYLLDWLQWDSRVRAAQAENPPPIVLRLREIKARQRNPPIAPRQLRIQEKEL